MEKKNWFKSLIFEDDESENKESTDNAVNEHAQIPGKDKTKEKITSETNLPKIELTDPSTITGVINQDLLTKLCAVLDGQNLEKIDYLKFKKSVDSLKSFQPEEDVRFATAFITLKASNPSFSKEFLLETIDLYVGLMEQERKTGLGQLNSLRERDVDKKEKEMLDAVKRVEKMKEEINKLTTFIAQSNEDITQKRTEYTVQEANFNATVDKIVNQLKDDKVKIETIIK